MPFVCSATWTAQPGQEETVRTALEQLSPASRQEPGNRYYQAYQDPAEPRVFRIFEVYDDEAAFAAHGAAPHFQQWALGQAIPVLETRQRDFYETLDF
jgi:quinol monooxygenase YgiN